MDYLGAAVSIAQNLYDVLQSSELKELCSVWGYQSELNNLESTMETIKAVLLDAESLQEQGQLSHQARLYVDQLKTAIYDADDLLDEFITIAEQKQQRANNMKDDLPTKLRRFFSFDNPLLVALHLSRGVKEVSNKLDSIAKNHSQYGLKLDSQPIRKRREETCSYVYTPDIIGREEDVDKIVGRLLDPNVRQGVSCLAIVGIGGLGKTTLAQLIFKDPRVEDYFPLRLWTCVGDQDTKHLDVKATLRKILHSATSQNHEHQSMDHLQRQVQERLAGKKYFLVLDDVWNEVRNQWLELAKFLMSGLNGSCILVTTRSEETAMAVGDKNPHKLEGLSEEDSWCLFEMAAFGESHEQPLPSDLVEIGQDIVRRCANVPLAIRVVGSLLYGQGKKKWSDFRKIELSQLIDSKNVGIGPILKLSFYHLDPPLKTCFTYCALFPKDHIIEKDMLIRLWMAQDYIVVWEGQTVEDVGDEYFSILVKRCFFQDVGKDEYGEIVSCKIHDLMHDIAQEIAGKDVVHTPDPIKGGLDNRVRHMSYAVQDLSNTAIWDDRPISFTNCKIRTRLCIRIAASGHCIPPLSRNWMCLRTLGLSFSRIRSLPSDLGKLLHLRYLDLSSNSELELLPNSFGELHNLQTLSLRHCFKLRELPKDLAELVKLRVLDIEGCWKLNSMPEGMGKLTCLHKLPLFLVGDKSSSLKQSAVDQMEELKCLRYLKDNLKIEILPKTEYADGNVREGGYIRHKEHLNSVHIEFPKIWIGDIMAENEQQLLLEHLQPPCHLRELRLHDYGGKRMPSWTKEDDLAIFLPNLVKLQLKVCCGWKHLPSLRKLRNLKSLELLFMYDLEYIENKSRQGIIGDGVGASQSEPLFPLLERLTLAGLPKLKGWWRDDDCEMEEGQECRLTSFPSLSQLAIEWCPEFTCVITCPNVERLCLVGECNEKLRIMIPIDAGKGHPKLSMVDYVNARTLKCILPVEAFQAMDINLDEEMESLLEVEEVFRNCSSSLNCLQIYSCSKLKSVSGGLEHLTALESLKLIKLPNLSFNKAGEGRGEGEGGEEDEMPWRCLQSLRSLQLCDLPKLVKIPKGIRHLTSLKTLEIRCCKGLESMPESMRELISLTTLEIYPCSDGLEKRCQKNTGEDWPNIQHIFDIRIYKLMVRDY